MISKDSIIWFNGEFLKFSDCTINLFTHALHYGTSVFEGCRIYNGNVFKMREHNERLIKSGEIVDVPIPYSVQELNDATTQLVKQNHLKGGYVRPFAWRGDESLGIMSIDNKVNVAILMWAWGNYYGENKIQNGLRLYHSDYLRPDPRTMATQAKVGGGYYIGSFVKNKANRKGYDDVLMLDWRGYVAECSGANVFFIKNNKLYTPIPDCFLNGITRQTVIEIAKELNIECIETNIYPYELNQFEECFITGTAAEIMPVSEIFDTYKYTNFSLTNKIRNFYFDLVNR